MVTSTIVPFGNTSAETTISKTGEEIGLQTFLGCTVVDFSCNSSWDSQGASCTINLVEDSEVPQRMSHAVVGSPQFFEVATTGDTLVFKFYGVLKDIGRKVDANGQRSYSATLQSPSVLLQACSIITQDYAGAGDATEAIAPNVATSLDFGHNDPAITWGNVYNVLNPFGVFENDDYGLSTPLGFGASQVNDEGMRLDNFVNAVDALVNDNSTTNNILGGPIIYGADDYNTNPQPYHYSFDINDFVNQLIAYIPYDYRVKSDSLMGFVEELCNETNHVFMVDLLKPAGSGNPNISGTAVAPLSPPASTVFGGQIKIITQSRNAYPSTKFPLSKYIINREIPDKIGGFSLTSFSPAFSAGFNGVDLPLDFPWVNATGIHPGGPAVASSPFGGDFPVEDITADNLNRLLNSNLNVSLNEGAVAGKIVTGGFQSRINFVPSTNNVYQYWGDIKRLDNFGSNVAASDTAQRGIPVITAPLDPNDLVDCIMIDCQDAIGTATITDTLVSGVYPCSMLEMRYAMVDFKSWMYFMSYIKPGKMNNIQTHFAQSLKQIRASLYDTNGNLTFEGKSYLNNGLSNIGSNSTSSANSTSTNISCVDPVLSIATQNHEEFLQKLHGKINSIGQEHYGKSWLVTMPAFTTKTDQNAESVIANYVKSWEISSTAYLEPTNFLASEAPQSPYFVNDGRLSAYVNFDANFTNGDIYNGATVNYDFGEYANDKFAQTLVGTDYIFSFLTGVEPEYIFLESTYFTNYARSNFTTLINGSGVISNTSLAVKIDTTNVNSALSYLLGSASKIVDNGVGMLPFALCKTNRVYNPLFASATAGKSNQTIHNLLATAGFSCPNGQTLEKNIGGGQNASPKPFPSVITPRSFGVPTQSNRFIYGPWITNNITLDYAARVEHEEDDSLVPENYIIPTTITIGGVPYTITSGLSGLNTVGQAKANTVENFDFLFTENGTVSEPGLPTVTSLAQSLTLNGPLVSDISVSISVSDVSTSYSMKTFAPKLGRTNKRIIDNITKLGRKVKSISNLVK